MKILPDNAAADIYTQVLYTVTANIEVIIGVLAIGIAAAFVMRWFNDRTGQTAVGRWVNDQRNKRY